MFMTQANKELQKRYASLSKRFNKLCDGKGKVSITLEYTWCWDSGEKGSLWLADHKGRYQEIFDREDILRKAFNEKLRSLLMM